MRIVNYLLQHKGALCLIFALLIVQAFCDLQLPNYTSNIVNIGIQQSGIEDAATAELSKQSYDLAVMISSDEEAQAITQAYDWDSENNYYVLNSYGYENRSNLDSIMTIPLILANTDTSSYGIDLSQVTAAYNAGLISKETITQYVDQFENQMSQISDSLLEQQGLAAATNEYNSIGIDTSSMQMDYLIRVGLIMLGLSALSMLVSIGVGFLASRTGAKIGQSLREKLFAKVISFSDKEINSFSAASLITRGTNDIQLIQMVCIILQRVVLYAPILAIGGIIMVASHTGEMWWIVALAIVAVSLVMGILMLLTMPKFKIMQKLIDKVNLVAREQLVGMPVVRAFGRESYEEDRFEHANADLTKTQLFTNRAMSFMMPGMTLVMNATSVLIVWIGAQYVDLGTIQTGDLIALITYSMMIVMGFLMIGMVAILLPRASVAAGRIDEVIATEPSITDPTEAKHIPTSNAQGATITFKDVCFAYDNNSNNVLSSVSFVAEPGKTTAIIGSTGSGKSTIIKLIERFHDVSEGAILVDGVNIRDINQKELRSMFGYVPQKAFLFTGTIESNIGYSGDTSQERRDLALDIAQATEFINEKEEGLATEISQGGTNVSGGQRQRLAIARALAMDARAYLFDDSFSALDYKTDAALRQGIATKLKGRTVLIVAQRIATIMNADHIIVLDEGRVVGKGTHEQLLHTCSIYREIALSQLSEEELFPTESISDDSALKGGVCYE